MRGSGSETHQTFSVLSFEQKSTQPSSFHSVFARCSIGVHEHRFSLGVLSVFKNNKTSSVFFFEEMSRSKVIRASRIYPSPRSSPTKAFSVFACEKMSSGKAGVRALRVCAVQGPTPTKTFSFFPLNKSLQNHPVFTRFSLGVHSVFKNTGFRSVFYRCSRTPVFARFSLGVLSVFKNNKAILGLNKYSFNLACSIFLPTFFRFFEF